MSEYKLTIIMPSYNKAKYIKEAIESILMQKTDYLYQIIIADDCSIDDTLNIIKEYQKTHSNIVLLTSPTNQGLYKNVLRAYEMTKTDYFCVLDPDDFWIDEYKIQKSLNFLESNKDFIIYYTNCLKQTKDGKREAFVANPTIDFTFNDFLIGKGYLSCTTGSVFRNVIFKDGIPDKMKNLRDDSCLRSFRGDSFRNFIHLEKGKAHAVNEFDAVYRITDEGIYQGLSQFEQSLLNVELFINAFYYFDEKYMEFLTGAYQMFMRVKNQKYIYETDDLKLIKQYLGIEKNIQDNEKNILEFLYKKLKLKYKIFYHIYQALKTKLKRKGIY